MALDDFEYEYESSIFEDAALKKNIILDEITYWRTEAESLERLSNALDTICGILFFIAVCSFVIGLFSSTSGYICAAVSVAVAFLAIANCYLYAKSTKYFTHADWLFDTTFLSESE